ISFFTRSPRFSRNEGQPLAMGSPLAGQLQGKVMVLRRARDATPNETDHVRAHSRTFRDGTCGGWNAVPRFQLRRPAERRYVVRLDRVRADRCNEAVPAHRAGDLA